MRRNLAAARSGAAGVGVLGAAGAGSARLIGQFVVGAAASRARSAGAALLRGGVAASGVRGSELGVAVHLRAAARLRAAIRLLRTGAARLTVAISRGAATRFGIVCHRLLPAEPPLHF